MIHGDVKSANILIFDDPQAQAGYTAKLSDLGFSASSEFNDLDEVYHGTDIYNPPEVRERGHGPKKLRALDLPACDVYSFGLLVWTIFKRGTSFPQDSDYLEDNHTYEQMLNSAGPVKVYEKAIAFAQRGESQNVIELLNAIFTKCLPLQSNDRSSRAVICELLSIQPLQPYDD